MKKGLSKIFHSTFIADKSSDFGESAVDSADSSQQLHVDVTSDNFGNLESIHEVKDDHGGGLKGERSSSLRSSDKERSASLAAKHDDIHDHHHDQGRHTHYGMKGQLLHRDSYNDRDDYDKHDHNDYHEEDHRHRERKFKKKIIGLLNLVFSLKMLKAHEIRRVDSNIVT